MNGQYGWDGVWRERHADADAAVQAARTDPLKALSVEVDGVVRGASVEDKDVMLRRLYGIAERQAAAIAQLQ